jgi:hypothetical protein
VTENVPSAAVVTAGSSALVPSGRVRVTASCWAPGAELSDSVRRPSIVSGSSAVADAGAVRLIADEARVAPGTRQR